MANICSTTPNSLRLITWDPTDPVATRPLAIQKDGTWYSAPTRPATQGSPSQVCSGLGGGLDKPEGFAPQGRAAGGAAVSQPIQWSSEYADTDLALIYYNYRLYNPLDGRWTGRDPKGIVSNNGTRVDRWYHRNIKIVISPYCYKMAADLQFDDIMGHELIHARDLCRKGLNPGSCEKAVCSEMQASIINACFMYSGEKLRSCLLERVPKSASVHCPRKDMKELINNNFDTGKCINHALL